MPRRPTFKPCKRKGRTDWCIEIPPRFSSTQKRQQLFFPSRDKADLYAQNLRAKHEEFGSSARTLPPAMAEDAAAAAVLLAPWKISLVEAARFIVDLKSKEVASCSVKQATAAFILSREGLRPGTLKGYSQITKRLDAALGDRVLATLKADEIATAAGLGAAGAAAAQRFRCVKAFWLWCVKKGWCEVSAFSPVESPRVNNEAEISLLSVEEARSLLAATEEHYPQAVASFALQLFAGIRVEELARLESKHVTAAGIELGASITKKGRRRHITPNATLAAWLAKYPFAPVANWPRVSAAVRRLAGWDVAAALLENPPKANRGAWPQNALRHSHASYAVASGTALETLLFEFGHTGNASVLRAHYVGKASKKQALEYFAIMPAGVEAPATIQPVESVA